MRYLELGCGDRPRKEYGWENLDAVAWPGVEHVQLATDLSNFPDNTFDIVETKDMIEHLSWRDIDSTLIEWRRVLIPGGKLIVETPNAQELADLINHPDCSWKVFSTIAYGNQDYPENTHKCYFKPEWLRGLLAYHSFKDVTTLFENLQRFRLEATK